MSESNENSTFQWYIEIMCVSFLFFSVQHSLCLRLLDPDLSTAHCICVITVLQLVERRHPVAIQQQEKTVMKIYYPIIEHHKCQTVGKHC